MIGGRDDDGESLPIDPAHEAAVFESNRRRLWSLAYRCTSSTADADDIVQETWLRWRAQTPGTIRNPAGWLTTVATRLAIDQLRSARSRREVYVGSWLPEPVVSESEKAFDPADVVALADSLTMGFLSVLDRLDPVERAVFLLREVFAWPYGEIATAVDRTVDNVRQINSRARRRVRRDRPNVASVEPARRAELLDAFAAAVADGELDQLHRLLHEDVVLIGDGGAAVRAARRPVLGRDRVARLLVNLAARVPTGELSSRPVMINGQLGLLVSIGGVPILLQDLDVAPDGRVVRIHHLLNPDKLTRALANLDAT